MPVTRMTEPPAFVWRSRPESVDADIISAVAIAEIFVAVGAYWLLWEKLSIQTLLWVSIFVAPLLLLRSEASVAEGVKWAEQYMYQPFIDANNVSRSLFIRIMIWQCARPIAGFIVAYLVLPWILPIDNWWLNILVAFVLGYASGQFAMAISVAVLSEELLLMAQRRSYVIAGITGVTIALAAIVAVTNIGPSASISFVLGATITILSGFGLAVRPQFFVDSLRGAESPGQVVGTLPAWFIMFAPGMVIGGRSEERRVGKECRSRWSPY